MKKLAFILMLLASTAYARGGPRYAHSEVSSKLDDEVSNIYENLEQTLYNTGRISSATITSLTASSLTASSATITHLLGTTTNDSATVGTVGEYIESIFSSVNMPATATYGDATSISLTAGDWDVSAICFIGNNSAVWTGIAIGISTTSGNSTSGTTLGSNRIVLSWVISSTNITEQSPSIPSYRLSLSGTSTVYFKMLANYTSGGPPTISGRLSARRVR